jgi:hypothetical protein
MDQDALDQLADLKEQSREDSRLPQPELLEKIDAGEHEIDIFVGGQEISVAYTFRRDCHLLTMLSPLNMIPENVVQEIVAIFLDSPQELPVREHPFGRYFIQSTDPTDAEGFTAFTQQRKETDPPPGSYNPECN